GDHVAEGAPVARLEAAEAEIDLAHAREQARALGHQIIEAEAQKRREEATLRRFERELQRQLELRARGVIADGALDIARAERDAAEARVAEAAARIERLGADLSGAQRLVDRRREALAQTVVTAPFDGIIVSREREIGDVVTAGTPILEIVDPGTLVLSTRLDESQMAQMAHGQPAVVFFESEPVRSHAATVTRISREVDPETREFALKLALETLPRNWAIGQRGSAAITIAEREDVLALPTALVGHRRGSAGAWVLENGRAHWREVELGGSSDGKVAVLAGLEDGDTALEGETLYRGMRVEVGR
ncbi:MAG: efflux RND transporter periplasmic adaptor subunit, partial [Pseudomonadota bacterium]